jgi:hypothetical protein
MRRILLVIIACLATAAYAQEKNAAVQTVQLSVMPITRLNVSGDPQPLVLKSFPAGQSSARVADRSTTYSLTSNQSSLKIVASIDRPMPHGTQLLIALESSLGRPAGTVDVSAAVHGVNVVSDLRSGADAAQQITYAFVANRDAERMTESVRAITLTVTN